MSAQTKTKTNGGFARRFLRREDGAAAVYVSIMIAVLVAFVGLAIDFGRFYTTNSHAQNAADAAAIAGASQLDGEPDALIRATEAAQTSIFVANNQTFAEGDANIGITAIRFLHSLPPLDSDPITEEYVTTDPADARFIEVWTEDLLQKNVFMSAVGAASGTTNATAVAGYKEVLCQFPPIMMCNPYETQPNGGEPFIVDDLKGVSLLAKTLGPDSQWDSGVMGLLSPPEYEFDTITANGAKQVAYELARVAPPHCFSSPVNIQTGAVNSMRNALNVRFDIYEQPFFGSGKVQKDPMFRPSTNVTKGYNNAVTFEPILDADGNPVLDGNGNPTYNRTCDSQIVSENDTSVMGLPPDECFRNATTGEFLDPEDCGSDSVAPIKPSEMTKRIGGGIGGDWLRDDYWSINHPDDPQPPGYASMSRYETYRYEIDNGLIPNNTATGGEDGNPQCYNNAATPPSDLPDRRLIYMAVINCIELGIAGNSVKDVPVEKYVKMFLIRPVAKNADTDIWLEFVDVVKPGDDDGVLHEMVQLYR